MFLHPLIWDTVPMQLAFSHMSPSLSMKQNSLILGTSPGMGSGFHGNLTPLNLESSSFFNSLYDELFSEFNFQKMFKNQRIFDRC